MGYARAWKEGNNRPVIGSFPMNFPGELAHAAGALPLILQESSDPITYGHGLLFPFYCGYTRSMVDQAAKGDLSGLDAMNYLICPNNHSAPILIDLIVDLCRKYEVDGMVIHASRTCRAFTNPQFLIADAATKRIGIQTSMFEGDVTDEPFYKDELLNSRVEAMLESIDARRIVAA